MHSFLEIYKHSDTLHHAYYFIEHKVEEATAKLKNFFEEVIGMRVAGNPDFFHRKYQTFSIEDARNIAENESRKDLGGSRKIFVIETDFITEEAQNALLKVFEEPTQGTHFFIISPQDILLPTLRSRMVVIDSKNESISSLKDGILSKNLKERMEIVKEITDGIKDEEMSKQDAIDLLNRIESELHQNGVEKFSRELQACMDARSYLYDRGAPIKIILENLMLSI